MCSAAAACHPANAYHVWLPLVAGQVDNRHQAEPVITPEQAIKLCDRNFGIGGDGVSWQTARLAGRVAKGTFAYHAAAGQGTGASPACCCCAGRACRCR